MVSIQFEHKLSEKVSENELIDLVDKLNNDENVQGILVQLPLPEHVNSDKILDRIKPEKDVDGFMPIMLENSGQV